MAREIYFYLKFTDVVKHIVVMVSRTVVMMGFSLIGTTAWTINVVVVVKKLHLFGCNFLFLPFLGGGGQSKNFEKCLQWVKNSDL